MRREFHGLSGAGLRHIDTWLFDLDNTLYPAECDLFDLVDQRMGLYIQQLLSIDPDEARQVQKYYFYNHGTTLLGLTNEHGIDPQEFLDFVHDISLERITPNPELKRHIAALPGRKIIYTNADTPYALRVLKALGLEGSFEAVFDINASDLIPKPDPQSYNMLCQQHSIDPKTAFFADDMVRNLRPAKAIGMATLWINNGSDQAENSADHSQVDHHTDCLTRWLTHLNEQEFV